MCVHFARGAARHGHQSVALPLWPWNSDRMNVREKLKIHPEASVLLSDSESVLVMNRDLNGAAAESPSVLAASWRDPAIIHPISGRGEAECVLIVLPSC